MPDPDNDSKNDGEKKCVVFRINVNGENYNRQPGRMPLFMVINGDKICGIK